MPTLDDQTESVDSSDTLNLDDPQSQTAESSVETQPEAAVSSPATGAPEDKDLLSVVRDVVDEKRAKSQPASPAEPDGVGDPKVKEPDDENYSDVPFAKHPRFRHLLQTAKANREDADRYRNVDTFLKQNGLSPEEASDGLQIMALAKHSPAEAWKRLRPFVEKVLVAAGEVLPDDLAARVQTGDLTQDAAQELSRARATTQSLQTQRTFEQQRQEQERVESLNRSLVSEADAWVRERAERDPNFADKQDLLSREVVYLQHTEGRPTTPQGVRDQLRKAYESVNARFTPPVAARPRTPVRPVTGGQVAGTVQPAVVSTLDIIRQHTAGR